MITAALIYCVAPGRIPPAAKKAAKVFYGLNCAHRGLYSKDQYVPENSLPAFAAAHSATYGIELDVQLSKDDAVVVFHDDNLKRVCGVNATVSSKDLNELAELSLFDTDEKIPLLTEVLEIIGDSPVMVELKPAGEKNEKLCEETLKIMRAQGQRWCIESFDPRIGAWFRKNAPDVLRGQLSRPPRELVREAGIPKATAFLLGNLLVNFISRPHFIAYRNTRRPLTVRLCRAMRPMKFIWTTQPGDNILKCEKQNDAVIFEHYEPVPRYNKKVTYL